MDVMCLFGLHGQKESSTNSEPFSEILTEPSGGGCPEKISVPQGSMNMYLAAWSCCGRAFNPQLEGVTLETVGSCGHRSTP